VVFAGTSTLLFDDGRTAFLTDGFFTRPPLLRVALGRIAPDPTIVDGALGRLGVDRLAAVICVHAHYDHALDAPLVAERTGALLVGSASTMNLGRGHGLPAGQLRPVTDGDVLRLGAFEVTVVASLHSPGDRFPGTIDAPLTPPARAAAWRSDTSFSVLVTHGDHTVLVQASANHLPGALAGRRAGTVYLGIGGLGRQGPQFRERYWDEVVRSTGAHRVVPIHWDDFFTSLDRPLRPLPHLLDDMAPAMRFVIDRCRGDGIELVLPVAWEPLYPFFASG
jgi:L-ascorbate metabolism protein UlaG (beta-lactamase superfamily)